MCGCSQTKELFLPKVFRGAQGAQRVYYNIGSIYGRLYGRTDGQNKPQWQVRTQIEYIFDKMKLLHVFLNAMPSISPLKKDVLFPFSGINFLVQKFTSSSSPHHLLFCLAQNRQVWWGYLAPFNPRYIVAYCVTYVCTKKGRLIFPYTQICSFLFLKYIHNCRAN